MSENTSFVPPEITDGDIYWATRLLDLPRDAFHGEDKPDPRQEVLKSMESMEISACPGSGKTTLLVAKLAILAKKWQYRTRGVCVLSHTNVARAQIESKLGNDASGRRLLSYPHFVGTIHKFVDDFLALPWLRSKGWPIKMIDSDICEGRRWSKLCQKSKVFLRKKHIEKTKIRIVDEVFGLAKKGGAFPCSSKTNTYKDVQKACCDTAKEGYHCYDDMFIWAREIMAKYPSLVHAIRDRFPLLFVDEAQDNNDKQSAILHRIFMEGNTEVVCQRFGDENQAIFDFMSAKEATEDKFPMGSTMNKDLPNSHRFGKSIANLADPLGLNPYPDRLQGHGPQEKLASGASNGRHTVFLFDDDSATNVLDAYGQLLIDTFSEKELREGTFAAVGQVHKDTGDDHRPRHVGHYWPDYDPELSRQDPKSQTFVQYVLFGMGRAKTMGEACVVVEKIAQGIVRLAAMGSEQVHTRRKHCHRYVMRLLEEHSDVRKCYEDLIARFAVEREAPTKETWETDCCGIVRQIAEAIVGQALSSSEATKFLEWNDGQGEAEVRSVTQKGGDNIYPFSKNGKDVAIRVGSIHSVKGQTHAATLVLETFFHKRTLASLKGCLCGKVRGGDQQADRDKKCLKLNYVAMTRPTHLLCLAMKRGSFQDSNGDLDQNLVSSFQKHGWHIEFI